MNTIITINDIHAYTEVSYIISHMNERYIDMLPKQLITFFQNYSDPNYTVKLNPHLPLENQGLQRYALEIIAIMHLKYWCENEERKKELYNLMLNNNNNDNNNNNNKENLAQSLKYRTNIEGLFHSLEHSDDDENIDYSKPKTIQKYDIYSKENEDIKDYTDVVEDEEIEEQSENSLIDNKKEDKSLFVRLKKFIINLFNR